MHLNTHTHTLRLSSFHWLALISKRLSLLWTTSPTCSTITLSIKLNQWNLINLILSSKPQIIQVQIHTITYCCQDTSCCGNSAFLPLALTEPYTRVKPKSIFTDLEVLQRAVMTSKKKTSYLVYSRVDTPTLHIWWTHNYSEKKGQAMYFSLETLQKWIVLPHRPFWASLIHLFLS